MGEGGCMALLMRASNLALALSAVLATRETVAVRDPVVSSCSGRLLYVTPEQSRCRECVGTSSLRSLCSCFATQLPPPPTPRGEGPGFIK